MSRVLVIVLVLAVALTVGAFPAGAQPRVPAQPDAPQALQQFGIFADFDNDGNTDLAVGAPAENVGATLGAGAVSIFYGIAAGTGLPSASQTLVQANVEAGDQFGAALTVGNFNNDGFEDLAVGAPGEDLGATADAGAVNLFLGAAAGLTTSQVLVQDNPETGDQFGAALTAERFTGFVDLVVGAPGENVGATVDAGAANLFASAGAAGLPGVSGPALLQDNPEAGDQFGATLTGGRFDGDIFVDLVVGAPGENVGATLDAGAANAFANSAGVLPAVSGGALLQDNPEAGDQFGGALTPGFFTGDIFEDLVVGAPGENVGATVDAGAANLFASTTGVLPSVSGPALLQDNPEAGDQFGTALTPGFFDGVGGEDLVVGAPGENVGATVDAGAANLFANSGGGLPSVSGPALLQANVEAGDQFGAALTTKDLNGGGSDDLVAGAPGEDVGATVDAGAANVFANPAGVLPPVTSQTLAQANVEAGDQFGAALDS